MSPTSPRRALQWTLLAALARALAMPGFLGGFGWLLLFPAIGFRVAGWQQGARWKIDYLGGILFWTISFIFLVHVFLLVPLGAAIILGSCWVVEGWLFRLLNRRFSVSVSALLALPLAEFLRMKWFYLAVGGVPWANLGFALAPSPALPLASVLGEGGLVILAVALGLMPWCLWRTQGRERQVAAVAPIMIVVSAGLVMILPGTPNPEDSLRCLTVQPMIRIDEKHGGLNASEFFDREDKVTQDAFQAGERPDLVIWAETMWPFAAVEQDSIGIMRRPWPNQPVEERGMQDLQYEQSLMVRFLLARAENRPHFLTGAHFYYPVQPSDSPDVLSPRGTEFLLFDSSGNLLQHFSKHKLVPFGESLPFGGNFPGAEAISRLFQQVSGLRPDFARTEQTGPLKEVDGLPRLGGAVCWENVFEDTFRMQADMGAQAFLILSNEDWFGLGGIEMEQMVEATRLRALETGLSILRSTNTGVTCLVSPDGTVEAPLKPGETGWWGVDLPLRPVAGWLTPYRAFGWLLLPTWSLLAVLLALLSWWKPAQKPLEERQLDPLSGEG